MISVSFTSGGTHLQGTFWDTRPTSSFFSVSRAFPEAAQHALPIQLLPQAASYSALIVFQIFHDHIPMPSSLIIFQLCCSPLPSLALGRPGGPTDRFQNYLTCQGFDRQGSFFLPGRGRDPPGLFSFQDQPCSSSPPAAAEAFQLPNSPQLFKRRRGC